MPKLTARVYACKFPIRSASEQYDKVLEEFVTKHLQQLFHSLTSSKYQYKMQYLRYSSNYIRFTVTYRFENGMIIEKNKLRDYMTILVEAKNEEHKFKLAKDKFESSLKSKIKIEKELLNDPCTSYSKPKAICRRSLEEKISRQSKKN